MKNECTKLIFCNDIVSHTYGCNFSGTPRKKGQKKKDSQKKHKQKRASLFQRSRKNFVHVAVPPSPQLVPILLVFLLCFHKCNKNNTFSAVKTFPRENVHFLHWSRKTSLYTLTQNIFTFHTSAENVHYPD